jgi:hypothetical protein
MVAEWYVFGAFSIQDVLRGILQVRGRGIHLARLGASKGENLHLARCLAKDLDSGPKTPAWPAKPHKLPVVRPGAGNR